MSTTKKNRKNNVYHFDPSQKRKAKTAFDGDRIKLEWLRSTGKGKPRARRDFRPVVIFIVVVLAFTLISRWVGQLAVP
jgi:hypothetical protein